MRRQLARHTSRLVHLNSKRFLCTRAVSLDDHLHSSLLPYYRNERSSNPEWECSYAQYRDQANRVLPYILPYEPHPFTARRADCPITAEGSGDGTILVIHAVQTLPGTIEYTTCSGFLITVDHQQGSKEDKLLGVTCSHTLEEIEYRYPKLPKRSFALLSTLPTTTTLIPLSIISSLPRLDLLIFRPHFPTSLASNGVKTLPVSPYPVCRDQPVSVHFFGSPDPPLIRRSGVVDGRYKRVVPESWGSDEEAGKPIPWLGGMGWRRWVRGRMLGYRGDLWEEVEPGTADSLPYILTSPLPPAGSSGGPIIDTQSGAVIGMISGTRTDNRVEGERGWGSSAESIYELFSLPGFIPSSQRNGGEVRTTQS